MYHLPTSLPRTLFQLLLGLLLCGNLAWGQNLVTWDMAGANGASSKSASTSDNNLQSPTMSMGSGLTAHNYSNVNGLEARSVNSTSLNQAINNDEYFSFTLTPNSGKKFSVTRIRMRPYSQNRSRSFAVFSSVNGFSSGQSLGSKSYQGNNGSGSFKNVDITGHDDLTTPVEFRIYVYANSNQEWESCGFAGSADDFRVVGTSGNASNTYSLTINASNGSVSKSPNKSTYNPGETVSLTANPNSGYQFDNWSGALSGSQNPKTLTMNGNKTVTANFSSTGGGNGGNGGGNCGQTLSGSLKVEHCEPAEGDSYPSGSSIVIKPNFTSDITKVTFWVDGWNWIGVKSTPPFELTWNGASDGPHKIRIRGENASGTNTQRKDINITVGGGGGGGTNSLSVSPGNLSFNSNSGSATINVSSNISWTAADDRGWISLSPMGPITAP
ncbi:MAG: hypothetical protein AAF399_06160 [Bacteroidota bacterium]